MDTEFLKRYRASLRGSFAAGVSKAEAQEVATSVHTIVRGARDAKARAARTERTEDACDTGQTPHKDMDTVHDGSHVCTAPGTARDTTAYGRARVLGRPAVASARLRVSGLRLPTGRDRREPQRSSTALIVVPSHVVPSYVVPSRLVPLSLAMLSAAPVGMARREAVPSSMMPSGGGLPNEERRMRAASGLAVRGNVSGNRTESMRAGRTFETSRTFKPCCAMARPRHRSIQLLRALLRTAAEDHCHDYRQCARRGRATGASTAHFTGCMHL